MKRIFECAVMLRVYAMAISILYSVTAITQPESILYKVAHATGFGLITVYLMMVFAALGVADVILNDLTPDSFVVRRALNDRHLVSMGLAMCFCVQMFIEVRYNLPLVALPFYAVYVIMIPMSAFADVHKRYNKNKGKC